MKTTMKPFLVDVPVRVNIWIRPECQRKQFEVLKQARPSILFLISDWGRNEKECEIISRHREMFDEEIDWECTVYRLYESENRGMYGMMAKTRDFIWSRVDRCVYLEDDIIPSVSFFQYCAEMLEKYKDDERVNVICGMNHLGVYEDVNSDYFFSRQGSIWGIATWRRVQQCRGDFEYGKDPYVMKLLQQRTKHNRRFQRRYKAYAKQKYFEGHIAGGEFYYEFGMYGQNQLQIIPKRNMICNMGCSGDSAHSAPLKLLPKGLRRVFNMKTYELEFPIKHAKYVIPDASYEKKRNRIMGYNCPLISLYRKIESYWLALIHSGWKGFCRKIKKSINRGKQIEK